MVGLKHRKTSGYELSDRQATLELDQQEVKLNNETFNEPGEYEANGVEIVRGGQAALAVWEHLQIVYHFAAEEPQLFEKEQFSSSDVLIIAEHLPEISKNLLNELLDTYDPKIVVLSNANKLEAGLKESLKFQETNNVKLAQASLPLEGREFYLVA